MIRLDAGVSNSSNIKSSSSKRSNKLYNKTENRKQETQGKRSQHAKFSKGLLGERNVT